MFSFCFDIASVLIKLLSGFSSTDMSCESIRMCAGTFSVSAQTCCAGFVSRYVTQGINNRHLLLIALEDKIGVTGFRFHISSVQQLPVNMP